MSGSEFEEGLSIGVAELMASSAEAFGGMICPVSGSKSTAFWISVGRGSKVALPPSGSILSGLGVLGVTGVVAEGSLGVVMEDGVF